MTWDDAEEVIARAIYECWPTTFERLVATTETFKTHRVEGGIDSWEDTIRDDPTRAEECRGAARRVARALRAAGVALVPEKATEEMVAAAVSSEAGAWEGVIEDIISAGQIKSEKEQSPMNGTLRDRCRAFLEKAQRDAVMRQGSPVDDLLAFVLAERGRAADPALEETLPLVLYFGTAEEREEFVAAVQAVKPMITKRMP
jgi:hypothetical protein